jgi:hypothetical protein
MGKGFILAAPNHLGNRFSTWVATSEASASMAAANLATSDPSQFWRSASHNPWLTSAYGYNLLSNFFQGSNLDAFAICAHNLRPTTGRWRVRVFDGVTSGSLPNWIKPNTHLGTWGNVTGEFTDVDESPLGALDGNKLTPTNPALSMTGIHMGFDAPAKACAIGSIDNPLQAFVLDVNLITNGGPDVDIDAASADAPYAQVSLYEGGILVRSIHRKAVHSATEQQLIFPWDASEISAASGAHVEIFIDTFSGGAHRIEVQRVSWWQEDVDFQDAGGAEPDLLLDSGWLTAVDDPQAGTAFASFRPTRRAIPETSLHRFEELTENPVGIVSVQFMLMDDHAQPFPTSSFEGWIPITPDGYLQVGVGYGGRAAVAQVERELGPLAGIRDFSTKNFTDGGGMGGSQLPRLRKAYLPWEWLTTPEGMAIYDRLLFESSILTSHVVSVCPDDPTERRHTTIYCTREEAEIDLRAVNNNQTFNRGLGLVFVERR